MYFLKLVGTLRFGDNGNPRTSVPAALCACFRELREAWEVALHGDKCNKSKCGVDSSGEPCSRDTGTLRTEDVM